LAGPYAAWPTWPRCPEIDDSSTIEPEPWRAMCSMANLQVRNMPRPSTAITWSQSAADVWSMVLSGITPALATSTSTRP